MYAEALSTGFLGEMTLGDCAVDFRELRALGTTGLRVSRLGFGSSYGAPAAAYEMAFHEHGVNFFYWGSIRRAGMGEAIRHLSRAGCGPSASTGPIS